MLQQASAQPVNSGKGIGAVSGGLAIRVISIDNKSFVEAAANNGSINNASPKTVTLSGSESFTGTNGEDFVAGGKVTIANLPSGLTVVMTRTSSTALSVTITGNASSHAAANSVSNISFAFQNSAFVGNNASIVSGTPITSVDITFNDPSPALAYGAATFSESISNNGGIDNASPIIITLSNDTFTGADNDDFVAAGKLVVTNLSSGLTAVATRTSATTLSITLTGTASAHAAANNVANLTFTFQNSAFTNTAAASVTNAVKSDLQVSFMDPYTAHVLSFDGVNDYVNLPIIASPTAYTVEMWVRPLSTSNALLFVRTTAGGPVNEHSHELRISNGKFEHFIYDGDGHTVTGTTTVVAGRWYHVAIQAQNGGTMRLFVNGVEEGTGLNISTMWTFGNRYQIGRNGDGLQWFNGLIDEIRISDNQRYSSTFTPPFGEFSDDANTVALFHCNETSGSTIVDHSSNQNTGTLVNGVSRSTLTAALTYSAASFSESAANSGAIDNTTPMIITLSGSDTFTGANNDNFVADGKVTVTNVPSGLTAVATRTSASTLSVTLTGSVTAHAAANSITNLTVTFQNSAFTAGTASSVANAVTNDRQVSFMDPYSPHALSFDGTDDYVNIPLAATPTAYTIEMWVKPASTSNAVIFVRTDADGPTMAFSHELDIINGKFQHYMFDGGSYTVIGTTSVVANTWYHVAITSANNGMMRLYVNGVEEGTAHSVGTMWEGGTRYVLNGYRNGGSIVQYSGLVDDLRIWDSQRSQAQIAASMNVQLTGSESGLIGFWNFDEGNGTTIYDRTSNQYNGTLVNGTSFVTDVTPLPVELSSFTAAGSGRGTELRWSTASETNNYGFDVERQRSGTWERLGFVPGHGTSNAPHAYSYTDVAGPRKAVYRLKQVDRNGSFTYSPAVEAASVDAPKVFGLSQNYPNPFNPSTTLSFTVAEAGNADLSVYNVLGQKVATLFHGSVASGTSHRVSFDASGLASGIYIARLQNGAQVQTMKMNLQK